jgi:hypothetical protein
MGGGRFHAAARLVALAIGLTLVGCRSCEPVEAELRAKTFRLERAEAELLRRDAQIASLNATVAYLQQGNPEGAPLSAVPPPEVRGKLFGLDRIDLGRGTGGKDADRDGRDDGVQAVISPIDAEGDVLKCPGRVELQLLQVADNGTKSPAGIWVIEDQDLRRQWRPGIFGTGYHVAVPFAAPPSGRRMRLVAKFTALDGRTFEAERDFNINLAPAPSLSQSDLGGAFIQPVAWNTPDPARKPEDARAAFKPGAWTPNHVGRQARGLTGGALDGGPDGRGPRAHDTSTSTGHRAAPDDPSRSDLSPGSLTSDSARTGYRPPRVELLPPVMPSDPARDDRVRKIAVTPLDSATIETVPGTTAGRTPPPAFEPVRRPASPRGAGGEPGRDGVIRTERPARSHRVIPAPDSSLRPSSGLLFD